MKQKLLFKYSNSLIYDQAKNLWIKNLLLEKVTFQINKYEKYFGKKTFKNLLT